jgi:hypothetical protein
MILNDANWTGGNQPEWSRDPILTTPYLKQGKSVFNHLAQHQFVTIEHGTTDNRCGGERRAFGWSVSASRGVQTHIRNVISIN